MRVVLLGSDEPDLQPRAAAAARAQTIPIVAFSVAAAARFSTLGALVAALRTRKLIFLHRPGGLRQGGELLPLVNLTTDAAALAQSKELSRKERVLVDESRRLVERTPHRLSVAITSPLNLFRELFTIKGAGTLLRRGALIERRRFVDLDRERLRALLTRSFGRPPVAELFGRDIAWGYVEEGYRGAALVHETPLGAYLSKFAVDAEAQGEGIGRDLWQALSGDYTTHFLARPGVEPDRCLVRQAVRRADALSRLARLLEGAAASGCGGGGRVGARAADRSAMITGFAVESMLGGPVPRKQDVPTINLDELTIAREVLDLLPGEVALRHHVLPVNAEDGTLVVAMSDPSNLHAVDQVKRKTGMSVEVCLAETRALRRAIDRYYFPN